ncbi:GntR family transcriptional regulator [uncultured Jannaschia sp.]|uniref:GntR family transcriptional regulator n=1 Tax=uncultured Jannaschia sp. TaxID=293347 RepID=UPI00262409B4|nr:GntR family transcriptional regulator [uncultured Jannaschia sp.]
MFRITEVLQEKIASQDLRAGARLHEQALAEEFGTSRTVIREVLGWLEQRSLVERVPNRGAFVKGLSEKEVLEIFDIREWLESLLTVKATEKAPDGHWQRFLDAFSDPLREQIAAERIDVYNAKLEELRQETARVADNEIANSFIYHVLDRARVIKIRITLLPGRAERGRELHLQMLRCMAARDTEGAERFKRDIISSARELFRKYKPLIL